MKVLSELRCIPLERDLSIYAFQPRIKFLSNLFGSDLKDLIKNVSGLLDDSQTPLCELCQLALKLFSLLLLRFGSMPFLQVGEVLRQNARTSNRVLVRVLVCLTFLSEVTSLLGTTFVDRAVDRADFSHPAFLSLLDRC